MRNLRNTHHRAWRFAEGNLTATAFEFDDVIGAFGPSHASSTITLKRFARDDPSGSGELITSWDAPSPSPDLSVDRILNLHCFPDTRILSLVLEGGDIIVVRQDPQPGESLIEIVGSVDRGISAARWSPDDELLAIATKADTLLFMTRDFEGTVNAALSSEDLNVSNHVSVGWGKKETQFKGRGAAKALRDPTIPERVDGGILSPLDHGGVFISWRGDGQYVAINSVLDLEPKRRVIRVFSREGSLESVSEPVDGLDGTISWKPSGQLIAGVQRLTNDLQVVFFERNGLRHGEFSLRLSQRECETVGRSIALRWNSDSTVLAVALADRVQLWTVGNFHYYLKQEISLATNDASGIDGLSSECNINWHPEKALQLICWDRKQICKLNYTLSVSRGSMLPPHDLGLVAVVDGKMLKVTPLRTANSPPPMALDEIELSATVRDVAFNHDGSQIAVLHSDSRISHWTCDYAVRPARHAKFLSHQELVSPGIEDEFWRQIVSASDGELTYLVVGDQDGISKLALVSSGLIVSDLSSAPLTLFNSADHKRVFMEDETGSIFHIDTSNAADPITSLTSTLENSCQNLAVWESTTGKRRAFGLADNGILHAVHGDEPTLRIPKCTSFLVTSTHLIYTTSNHFLKFVHMHDEELDIPPDEPEKDERCRNIERGAKLVAVIPSTYSVVLQMPRGNLETIWPRALVLAGIRMSITEKDYKTSFMICRTHRVDLNILHDYAPEQFMSDVDLFVRQVKKAEYIDLFLSSLSDEIGRETLSKRVQSPVSDSKVNRICDAFLQVLHDRPARLQNVITAHVCKIPPDLEAGLSLVSKLRQQEKQEQLEQAVEHICFLADVNQLYDAALGLYDLDVALLVAQQSQKDPREYLPYLQRLHDTEPHRQRFQIDSDLKRYSKALSHLHALDEFEELKSFMVKHELYSAAMKLYRYDNTRLSSLMRLYADFMSSRSKYREAGVAYEFVEDYRSASEAYRASNMWRECLAAAALVPVTDEELAALAKDLADSLEESKDFNAAATVHMEYLNDLQSAVRLFCKAHQFGEAMRLLAKHRQPERLKSLFDPGLIDASASMTELLAEMRSQIAAQLPRLRELRQKKADDPMVFLDDGGDGGEDGVPDNISLAPTDASTTGTFMTRYTNRSTGTLATDVTRKTSKNRRREERKRARGKKGTVYEEEYLVNSIARLIERLNSVQEDVGRLVEGLMRRAMRERAVAVEISLTDVFTACQSCLDEVFLPGASELAEKPDGDLGLDGSVSARPPGGQGVLWEAMTVSTQRREVPVLKPRERFSLLL